MDTAPRDAPTPAPPGSPTSTIRPGAVLAFAHRGGAYHPELDGLENTLAAFRHAGGARLPLPRDRRARDPRRRAAGLPRRRARPGHRPHAARSRTLTLRRDPARRWIGGREPIPTLAELFDAFPDARFNIDLKSDAARAAAGRLHRGARGLGPGAGRLVLAAPARPVPAADRRPGADLGAPRCEVVAFRFLPQRPAGRPASTRGRRRRAAGPAPPRPAHGHHRRSGPARARGR